MFVVRWLSLFVASRWLVGIGCSLFVVAWLVLVACWLLFARCVLLVVSCRLFLVIVWCCVCCCLCVVHGLMFVVCGSLCVGVVCC